MSYGPKKKEPRDTCLSEDNALRSQRMWAEVSSFTPHLLHKGLSNSPNRWRCLLSMLCPVRRPVTTLDWVLFKDKNLALAARLGRDNSRACLWVPSKPSHLNQQQSLLLIQGGVEPTDTFHIWILRLRDSLSWLAGRGTVEERTPFHMVRNNGALERATPCYLCS